MLRNLATFFLALTCLRRACMTIVICRFFLHHLLTNRYIRTTIVLYPILQRTALAAILRLMYRCTVTALASLFTRSYSCRPFHRRYSF
jgi:hypothetical protein